MRAITHLPSFGALYIFLSSCFISFATVLALSISSESLLSSFRIVIISYHPVSYRPRTTFLACAGAHTLCLHTHTHTLSLSLPFSLLCPCFPPQDCNPPWITQPEL